MKSFLQEKFSTCLKRKHSIRYLWRISRTWIPKYHKNHCQKSLNTIWLSTVWTTRYGVQTDWTQSIGEMHAIFISFYCTYFSLCPISSKIKNNNANGTHTICNDTPKATMIILSTRKKKNGGREKNIKNIYLLYRAKMGMKRVNGFLVAFAIFAAYLPLSVWPKGLLARPATKRQQHCTADFNALKFLHFCTAVAAVNLISAHKSELCRATKCLLLTRRFCRQTTDITGRGTLDKWNGHAGRQLEDRE